MMHNKPDAINLYTPVRTGEPFFYRFEEDFVEHGIRCIPMIVRFKLDIAGIKLKLSEWSRFSEAEKQVLAATPCVTTTEIEAYGDFITALTFKYTGNLPVLLETENLPPWYAGQPLSKELKEKAAEFGQQISPENWLQLNNLQRFALLKLCRPGHENRNFPLAMEEFNLIKN